MIVKTDGSFEALVLKLTSQKGHFSYWGEQNISKEGARAPAPGRGLQPGPAPLEAEPRHGLGHVAAGRDQAGAAALRPRPVDQHPALPPPARHAASPRLGPRRRRVSAQPPPPAAGEAGLRDLAAAAHAGAGAAQQPPARRGAVRPDRGRGRGPGEL